MIIFLWKQFGKYKKIFSKERKKEKSYSNVSSSTDVSSELVILEPSSTTSNV